MTMIILEKYSVKRRLHCAIANLHVGRSLLMRKSFWREIKVDANQNILFFAESRECANTTSLRHPVKAKGDILSSDRWKSTSR